MLKIKLHKIIDNNISCFACTNIDCKHDFKYHEIYLKNKYSYYYNKYVIKPDNFVSIIIMGDCENNYCPTCTEEILFQIKKEIDPRLRAFK